MCFQSPLLSHPPPPPPHPFSEPPAEKVHQYYSERHWVFFFFPFFLLQTSFIYLFICIFLASSPARKRTRQLSHLIMTPRESVSGVLLLKPSAATIATIAPPTSLNIAQGDVGVRMAAVSPRQGGRRLIGGDGAARLAARRLSGRM